MATADSIQYPPEPPPWLRRWPSEAQIRSLFPEGIRRLAYLFLGRERRKVLSWDAERLVLVAGDQQVNWHLRGDTWECSCSCGYMNEHCTHAYMAACLLHEVIRREHWGPGGNRPASAAALPPVPPPAAGVVPREQEQPGSEKERTDSEAREFEVEADFHHAPGQVVVRLYCRVQGRRELLRMQQVANLAHQARSTAPCPGWHAEDREFLRWLGPRLTRRSEVRANLQVLKLSEAEFEHWLECWQASPERILARHTQRPVTKEGTGAARLVFELADEGEWVRISAVVVTAAGRRIPFHEIYRELGAGRRPSALGGGAPQVEYPVAWDLLTRVFSRRDPRMRREHICAHLPDLLGGRLDALEGACVRRIAVRQAAVLLRAQQDGADVILQASIEGKPLPAEGTMTGALALEAEHFVVPVIETAGMTAVRALLQAFSDPDAAPGTARVPGTAEAMAALRERWLGLPADVEKRADPSLRGLLDGAIAQHAELVLDGGGRFLDVRVRWHCGDGHFSDQAVGDAVRRGHGVLRSSGGKWFALDADRVREIRRTLEEADLAGDDGMRRLFCPDAAPGLDRLLRAEGNDLLLGAESRALGRRIVMDLEAVPVLRLPEPLTTVLRHYQAAGFAFLANRTAHGVGAILADDMGLGKTLQVLAVIEAWTRRRRQHGEGYRALVVCPASVVGVWLEQAAAFTPGLRLRALTGPSAERTAALTAGEWDLAVTNYALLRADAESLVAMRFDLVVLDEAQMIKNPDAQVTRAAKALDAACVIAMTGTPLENRLLDLWSIMDCLNPGFLGGTEDFLERFSGSEGHGRLAERIRPVLLRRTKDAVAPELPPRTEEVIQVAMTPEQRRVYDRELLRAREMLRTRGPMEMLAALTRLRQVCCAPALIPRYAGNRESAKLDAMLAMLTELAEEGHHALVFSQFTAMLDRIRPVLEEAGLPTLTITGQTPTHERTALVQRFNDSATPGVFLLSLRAAGTGLSLTRADYVFIFDPWWNPAVERQAIDRTHRIGQENPVFAYRMVAADSVEERVLALQQDKAELFAAVVGGTEQRRVADSLTMDDIRMLLA
ncbi:MAG: DEAD/DEAH box helicase [Lentisphaeria bacterium]|nr:DEAD/DEAH box helicase [Lentisphaeria bacterium]